MKIQKKWSTSFWQWPGMSSIYCIIASSVLLVLSACGSISGGVVGSKQGSPAARQVEIPMVAYDPCTLFAKDLAGLILGGQVTVRPDFVSPICRFWVTSTAKSAGPGNSDQIVVAVGISDHASQYFDLDRNHNQQAAVTQDVKEIGDRAFFVKFATGEALAVLMHDIIYSITVIDPHLAVSTLQSSLKELGLAAQKIITGSQPSIAVIHPQPCALVSTGEASQHLQNKPVHWLFTANSAGVESCDYMSTLGVQDRVQVVVTNNGNLAKTVYTGEGDMQSQKKDVKGIGDAAFYDGAHTVWVLKGSSVFHVTVLGAQLPEAGLELFARQVARRF